MCTYQTAFGRVKKSYEILSQVGLPNVQTNYLSINFLYLCAAAECINLISSEIALNVKQFDISLFCSKMSQRRWLDSYTMTSPTNGLIKVSILMLITTKDLHHCIEKKFNGPFPASFFFIFVFSIQLTLNKCSI